MLYSKRVEESPYLFVRPFDDWRDKQRLVTSYAADGVLICRICDIDSVYPPSPSENGRFGVCHIG